MNKKRTTLADKLRMQNPYDRLRDQSVFFRVLISPMTENTSYFIAEGNNMEIERKEQDCRCVRVSNCMTYINAFSVSSMYLH